MAILKSDGTSFQKVTDVYKRDSALNRVHRVWVHDGTKFVLVKGRLYEVVWETDLSSWGGVSWDSEWSKHPNQNICSDMHILDDGSLLAIFPEYLNNLTSGVTNSGRYALAKFDANTGEMSQWGQSYWTYYPSQYYYLQPSGLVKLKDYFVFYTFGGGVFYLYDMGGNRVSGYSDSSWWNGSSLFQNDITCHSTGEQDSASGHIYIGTTLYNTYNATKSFTCYRLRYLGSTLQNDLQQHDIATADNHVSAVKPFYCGSGSTDRVVISYCNDYDYSYSYLVVTPSAGSNYTTGVYARIATLKIDSACEFPIYSEGDYIYLTHHPKYRADKFIVVKRRLSDLSLVWESSIDNPQCVVDYYGYSSGFKQPCIAYKDGFITDFGLVVYPNGKLELARDFSADLYDAINSWESVMRLGRFTDGFGYAMVYHEPGKVCKMVKLKEVNK